MVEKVPTGIPGLDKVIGGGIPKNNVILLAGGPGAGKTIMGCQFIYSGATKYGEKGIYVSIAETAESLKEEVKALGMNFDALEKNNMVKIMDLVAAPKHKLEESLATILQNVETFKAKRLVIDSFTAMSTATSDTIEVRVIAHLLQRFLLKMDCTTVLITEIPWGRTGIGAGVEEFISDGVILIEPLMERHELKRRLLVLKMRGSKPSKRYHEVRITDRGAEVLVIP